MKLISMTSFVLNKRKELLRHSEYKNDLENYANIVYNYANFLKQPLNLGMFVPCDEDRNVLEEPKKTNYQVDVNVKMYRDWETDRKSVV